VLGGAQSRGLMEPHRRARCVDDQSHRTFARLFNRLHVCWNLKYFAVSVHLLIGVARYFAEMSVEIG